MIGGICRVCGSALHGSATVACPRCETLHHADCWQYNGGCAVFGCLTGVNATAVVEAPPPAPPAGPDAGVEYLLALAREHANARSLAAAGIALFVFHHLPFLVQFSLTFGLIAQFVARKKREAPPLEPPVELLDETDSQALEVKAVAALVGVGESGNLAQAYALFEQRHPQVSLEHEMQRRLALELLDDGHVALGIEALDKAMRQQGAAPEQALVERRREVLSGELAFLQDALTGLPSLVEREIRSAVKPLLARHAEFSAGEGPAYLLRLWPVGLTPFEGEYVNVPSSSARISAQLVAGPFAGAELAQRFAGAWAAGQPVAACAAGEDDPPGAVTTVEVLHVSQKGVRFGREHFAWGEVRAIHFCQVGSPETTHELARHDVVRPRGGVTTSYATEVVRTTRYDTMLEVHAGTPVRRFRIDRNFVELFAYLGRRREHSYAFNAILAAKDMVRFGPRVRFSHGLLNMLSERTGFGSRFDDRARFEEYAYWFHGLGRVKKS